MASKGKAYTDTFSGSAAFIAVADTESFTAAARKLGVSTSHVSRQVGRLEEQLGSRLFARTTRRVSLTDIGVDYYKACRDAQQRLEEAAARARGEHSELSGHIRISAAGDFSETVVADALVQFAEAHPQLSIAMDFNTRVVNMIDEGFDFAIRYGQLKESNLVARKLIDRRLVAAAAPAYLARNGTPQTPQQLKQHQCLVSNSSRWVFQSSNQVHEVHVKGHWRANSARAVLAAARAGQGIVYLPETSLGSLLQNGILTPILQQYSQRIMPTWLVYPDRKFLAFRARKAVDFLLDYFADVS